MELNKAIFLGYSGDEISDYSWKNIDRIFETTKLIPNESDLIEDSDIDALFVKLGAKIDKEIIDKFPNLKYIGMLGTGFGGIDTNYATSKGIVVTNIADYATSSVSEFTFGILLNYLRDLNRASVNANNGNFSDEGFMGGEIRGKKFGVIGLGNIGTSVAKLANAFGSEVSYWSKNRKINIESDGIKYCSLEELITNSDFISLNLAYNLDTENIFNEELISKIKQNSILINTSPMELIDFDALVKRIQKNDFVFMMDHSDEITKDQLDILSNLKNVVLYPPIGYLTQEAGEYKQEIFVSNITNFLNGTPSNKVNWYKSTLYHFLGLTLVD